MLPANLHYNDYDVFYGKSNFQSKSYANYNNSSVSRENYHYSPYSRSSDLGYKNCQNWCPNIERGSFSQAQSIPKFSDNTQTNYENAPDPVFDSKNYFKGLAIFKERNLLTCGVKDSFSCEALQELEYPPYPSESFRGMTYGDRIGRRNYPMSPLFTHWDENESPVLFYRKRRR